MQWLRSWLGVELAPVTWREKAVAAAGGALAIAAVLAVSRHVLDHRGATMVVASMGASAVLLFAVPHGQLSQPWPVAGGHFVAAVIGVTSAQLIDQIELAAALAVGMAIAAMHQLKCIHPPGGATALTAVVAGPAVHEMGYWFVLRPVMLNVVVILGVAVVVHRFVPWHRYPAPRPPAVPPATGTSVTATTATTATAVTVAAPTHADVLAALRSFDSFIDITEADLLRLHELLLERRASPPAGHG